ncbi:hypothetical protein P4O66_006976, partial [Electrophorus voltai]
YVFSHGGIAVDAQKIEAIRNCSVPTTIRKHPLAEVSPDDVLPQPIDYDGTPVYAVRYILDSRRRGGTIQYLVNWEGFGPEEQSGVPCHDVLDPGLLSEFHVRFPDKLAPRPRGCPRRPLSVVLRPGSPSSAPVVGH